MKYVLATATFVALAAGSMSTARAENDSGFYAGAGVGQFNVKIDDIDQLDNAIERLDDSDASWKIFAGYRFNPYIALEAAYIDFGNAKQGFNASGSSGDYKVSLDGFAPYLIGSLPLGPVELFAKVGYYYYDVKTSIDVDNLGGNVFRSSKSDQDFLWGGGVGMTFFDHLHARLEYEKIEVSELDNSDALWLSGAWRF